MKDIREIRMAITASVDDAARSGLILEHNERMRAGYDVVHAFGGETLLDVFGDYLEALAQLHEASGIQRKPPLKDRVSEWRESRKPRPPLPSGVQTYVRKPPSRDEVLAVIKLGFPITSAMRLELQGDSTP